MCAFQVPVLTVTCKGIPGIWILKNYPDKYPFWKTVSRCGQTRTPQAGSMPNANKSTYSGTNLKCSFAATSEILQFHIDQHWALGFLISIMTCPHLFTPADLSQRLWHRIKCHFLNNQITHNSSGYSNYGLMIIVFMLSFFIVRPLFSLKQFSWNGYKSC